MFGLLGGVMGKVVTAEILATGLAYTPSYLLSRAFLLRLPLRG